MESLTPASDAAPIKSKHIPLKFSPTVDTTKPIVYELQCDPSSMPLTVSSPATFNLLLKLNKALTVKSIEIILPSAKKTACLS